MTATPTRARRVFAELGAWLTASVDQRRTFAHSVKVSRDTAAAYRASVLAHPDLAERLCKVYGLESADMWNGYVPPARDATGAPNRSRYREQLLAIVGEARLRESGGAP